MKKLMTIVLAMGMMIAGFSSATAQDDQTSYAVGFDQPATYIDTRGDEVATLTVTDIEDDWQDYDQYSSPERGYVFRAVFFTVENVSDSSMIVENYGFSLIDAEGRNSNTAWVSAADDAEVEIFSDDLPLAAGESADLVLVFQTPDEVPAVALMWQPEYGTLVISQFGEVGEGTAIANGMDSVATYVDGRGRPVAEVTLTAIDPDWQDFDEYSKPDRGQLFVAMTFTVTNISDSSIIVEPYSFTMLDSAGINSSRSWANAAEDSDVELFTDDTPLAPGESMEGVVVFAMYDDLTPVALVWQPESGVLVLNTVNGDSGTPTVPGGSDSDATPAS